MGQLIDYPVERKIAQAYLAQPEHSPGPGILIIHAWWGLNGDFREMADTLASHGYTVLVPDLYSGAIADTIENAETLRAATPGIPRSKQIAAAAKHLQSIAEPNTSIGVLGFSMGGFLALSLAESQPQNMGAVVIFYGARNGDYSHSIASYLLHFAETDPYVSANATRNLRNALTKSNRPTQPFTYPSTSHWFSEPSRPEYNPEAASQAWKRTYAFLKENLS